MTDVGYNQIVEHLLKIHFLMEPFCVSLERHLSKKHPLHQILKFHCRGLVVSNAFGSPVLLAPGGKSDLLMAFGHKGVIQLINDGYKDLGWEETDFLTKIKNRGLDNYEAVPYFPYRDDGQHIFHQIEAMVMDYLDIYYQSDADVAHDFELQEYFNEVSANGTGPDGGRGKLKGFPAKVASKRELIKIVTRLISQVTLQHAAVNYPLVDYAKLPITPLKLYHDPRTPSGRFTVHNFPNAMISALQSSFAVSLGTFRYDSLFDYSDQLTDPAARKVVNKHFCELRQLTEPILERRNLDRLKQGRLSYPYFLPRWLPNSVQT